MISLPSAEIRKMKKSAVRCISKIEMKEIKGRNCRSILPETVSPGHGAHFSGNACGSGRRETESGEYSRQYWNQKQGESRIHCAASGIDSCFGKV